MRIFKIYINAKTHFTKENHEKTLARFGQYPPKILDSG